MTLSRREREILGHRAVRWALNKAAADCAVDGNAEFLRALQEALKLIEGADEAAA